MDTANLFPPAGEPDKGAVASPTSPGVAWARAQAPLGDAVRAAHEATIAKHGAGDGAPVVPPGQAQPANAPSLPGIARIDPALVKQGVASVLKVVDGMIVRRIYRGTLDLGGDEGLAKHYATDVSLTTDEGETICSLTATLCEKYQIAASYAPELLLLVCVGGYGIRSWMAFRKLDELRAVKALAEKQKLKEAA